MIEKTEKINIDGQDVLAEIQIFDKTDKQKLKDLYEKFNKLSNSRSIIINLKFIC